MSVVQRCPHCGTTQSDAGPCQACHEAQVRYFCTNHEPGLWLDASTCAACGARFGEPARPPRPAAAAAPVRPRPSTPAPAPAVVAPARAPASPRRERLHPTERLRREPSASPMALLQKVLLAALRARHVTPRVAIRPERARPLVRGAGGCLMRLVLVVVLLFVALASAVFLFGRTLLQGY